MRSAAKVLFKVPLYQSLYHFGFPRILPLNYTFSLTFGCNSRCQTCNIWKKRSDKELTTKEWEKIFYALGNSPFWVTISGGEPFLRQDLVRICQSLYRVCRPQIITIPTNGLLPETIFKKTKAIVQNSPQSQIVVNVSLDNVGEAHDRIRGVRGNFGKAMETFKHLRRIRSKNLVLGVHTVVSRENVKDFPGICDFVLDQLKPDSYVTEIAEKRVELGTLGKNITPPLKDYKKAVCHLKHKTKTKNLKGFAKFIQAFRSVYYDLTEEILEKKTQVIPCYAGILSAQIAPNGDVWQCCVRADVLGNLKKENFDFRKIWFSERAKRIRKSIKDKECYCPLANVSYTNILMSPKALGRVILSSVNWTRTKLVQPEGRDSRGLSPREFIFDFRK